MRFDVVTLFPEFFGSPLSSGLIGKAIANEIATVHFTNPIGDRFADETRTQRRTKKIRKQGNDIKPHRVSC